MAFVPPARHLLRAKDLADARYAQPLDVDDMAGAAGLSRAHFSREFRRTFGESPHTYLLTRRLERAAALLRDTGSLRRRDLLLGGAAERRLLHVELRASLWPLAHRVPGVVPACLAARHGSDVRPAGLHAPEKQHVWRRQSHRGHLASARVLSIPKEEPDDQNRQRPALGPRPGRGARLLHREARLRGANRRHASRARRLPVAHGQPAGAARRRDRADGDPGPAGDGR